MGWDGGITSSVVWQLQWKHGEWGGMGESLIQWCGNCNGNMGVGWDRGITSTLLCGNCNRNMVNIAPCSHD